MVSVLMDCWSTLVRTLAAPSRPKSHDLVYELGDINYLYVIYYAACTRPQSWFRPYVRVVPIRDRRSFDNNGPFWCPLKPCKQGIVPDRGFYYVVLFEKPILISNQTHSSQ